MNLKHTLILTAMSLPLTFAATSANAFDGHGKHKNHCDMNNQRGLFKQLDLTDEQKTQVQQLRKAAHEEMKNASPADRDARRAERQTHQQAVQDLVLADHFDQTQAQALAQEMVNKQAQKRVQMLERQHQMLKILTPEQKSKWAELQQARAKKCQQQRSKSRD